MLETEINVMVVQPFQICSDEENVEHPISPTNAKSKHER